MEFQKISSPSLRELFVEQVQHMILSGKLKTGEKLPPERQLAEEMQVSRAVVNGGIADLQRMGFLIVKPRSGTYVADYRRTGTIETLLSIMKYNGGSLRNEEIRSIFEVRIALYKSNYKMWTYVRDKDVEGAVAWIEDSMKNCIEGDQQIYYE